MDALASLVLWHRGTWLVVVLLISVRRAARCSPSDRLHRGVGLTLSVQWA